MRGVYGTKEERGFNPRPTIAVGFSSDAIDRAFEKVANGGVPPNAAPPRRTGGDGGGPAMPLISRGGSAAVAVVGGLSVVGVLLAVARRSYRG